MARRKKDSDEHTDPAVISVLDQAESAIPYMGLGEVIEEVIKPWDDEAVLAESQMAGDMAKMVMERIQTLPTTWEKMPDNLRADLVAGVLAGCEHIARRAVEYIAARGRRMITGAMKRVSIGDEITLTITCRRSPEACSAMGMAAGGGEVAFILLDTEGLLNLGSPIQAGRVQKELDLGDGEEPPTMEVDEEGVLGALGLPDGHVPTPLPDETANDEGEACPV